MWSLYAIFYWLFGCCWYTTMKSYIDDWPWIYQADEPAFHGKPFYKWARLAYMFVWKVMICFIDHFVYSACIKLNEWKINFQSVIAKIKMASETKTTLANMFENIHSY